MSCNKKMLMRIVHHLSLFIIMILNSANNYAATECKFESGATLSIGRTSGLTQTLQPLDAVSAPTQISQQVNLNLSPSLRSKCSVGNDGENVYTLTQSGIYIGSIGSTALFATNVTGIAYSLAIRTLDNAVVAFFTSPVGSWIKSVDTQDRESLVEDKNWSAAAIFYQLPSYAGIPADVTSITPVGGTFGKVILGNSSEQSETDHPRPTVTITNNAFFIPVEKPTCTLTAPKTVNLGEYDVSDIENDTTLSVSFGINGNCTNTRKITMKLTTSKTTGSDGSLLANTASSNAAKGVGALIKWPNNTQIMPNSTSSYSVEQGTTIALFSASLTARLVKSDTEKVTSGQFSAIGTLQFTYE